MELNVLLLIVLHSLVCLINIYSKYCWIIYIQSILNTNQYEYEAGTLQLKL